MTFGPSTRAVHAGEPPAEVGMPVVTPIVPSTTFYGDASGEGEVLYTRYLNGPNHLLLAKRLAALEGAEDALALASGMAAMSCALLSCLQAGDHVVATNAIYGGTRILLDRELSRLGITTTYADLTAAGWESAFQPNTRVVLGETPSNPLLRVLDLRAISDAAHERGAAVIVDATFASPINLRPLEHGVDVVMHSGTKYLGGHSDVTAGVLAGSAALIAAVRERARVWGPALDPHACWLLERGIKTLALRIERHNANGMAVARWAEAEPGIARVHYPGLPSHPDHEIARRLLDGFGGDDRDRGGGRGRGGHPFRGRAPARQGCPVPWRRRDAGDRATPHLPHRDVARRTRRQRHPRRLHPHFARHRRRRRPDRGLLAGARGGADVGGIRHRRATGATSRHGA